MARQRVLKCMDEATRYIRKREPFRAPIRFTRYGTFCSLSGGSLTGWEWELRGRHSIDDIGDIGTTGNLPREYCDSVYRAEYVVRSFWTPIAWWLPVPGAATTDVDTMERFLSTDEVGHWVMPEVGYSRTTTQHQSDVRSAILNHGGSWRPLWTPGESQPLTEFRLAGAPEKVPSGCERW